MNHLVLSTITHPEPCSSNYAHYHMTNLCLHSEILHQKANLIILHSIHETPLQTARTCADGDEEDDPQVQTAFCRTGRSRRVSDSALFRSVRRVFVEAQLRHEDNLARDLALSHRIHGIDRLLKTVRATDMRLDLRWGNDRQVAYKA